jgi:glycine/D-amino acid oxidase-like deaminating enzyme
MRALVVGDGIFGVTAALELRARGHKVTLVGPVLPDAESRDLSKVVRCDYGADLDYTILGERALDGWRRWNAAWSWPYFHETGVAFLARTPMQPGGFEHDSFALLSRRGHRIERLDALAIAERFPAFRPGALVDGYFHHEGGWAEATIPVAQHRVLCDAAGVTVRTLAVDRIVDDGALAGDEHLTADHVVVCAGAWTQRLLPELAPMLRAVGQPIFYFQPPDDTVFRQLPVFGADIARTGYYGIPSEHGIVKVAHHGAGIAEPAVREVSIDQERAARAFLREVMPVLADAPATSRLCVYGDSLDGHFLIDRHPDRNNLTVAAGGSGHAFKFAPMLGALIADAVDGSPHPKFRWRTPTASRGDAARAHQ